MDESFGSMDESCGSTDSEPEELGLSIGARLYTAVWLQDGCWPNILEARKHEDKKHSDENMVIGDMSARQRG